MKLNSFKLHFYSYIFSKLHFSFYVVGVRCWVTSVTVSEVTSHPVSAVISTLQRCQLCGSPPTSSMSSMSVLCYPYGNGITCVCDEARIYKCFPHLKSDLKSQTGSQGGDGQLGQVHTANLNDGLDRRSARQMLASVSWTSTPDTLHICSN